MSLATEVEPMLIEVFDLFAPHSHRPDAVMRSLACVMFTQWLLSGCDVSPLLTSRR